MLVAHESVRRTNAMREEIERRQERLREHMRVENERREMENRIMEKDAENYQTKTIEVNVYLPFFGMYLVSIS
jgi:hypothetical protein